MARTADIMDAPTTARTNVVTDLRFIAGVVLAVVCIVAYTVLAVNAGDEPVGLERARGVFLFGTPFILALIAAPVVDNIKSSLDQNTRITQSVHQQTNGQLTKHIDTVATAAAFRAVELINNPTVTSKGTDNDDKEGDSHG